MNTLETSVTTGTAGTASTPSAPSEASGFAAMNLSQDVLRALDDIGYTTPTPVQEATYPLAIDGRDIIVQARTGTGKTAAFGIPLVDKIVNREPYVQALVLAPTRELALQSQREIARLGAHRGMSTVAVYGGAPMGKQVDDLKGGAQIVSGTPGRVLDHLKRGTLDASRLRVLVLDEMDEMLSMGFAKELNAILDFLPEPTRRQTMCFSATVDGEVRRHAQRHMNNPQMVSLSSDAIGVAQISHHVYMVSGADRAGDLVRILEVEDPESALIFCNMRSETERVAGSLKQAGFNADWLNGDLPQRDRERIMADTREGRLRYLVATDVAARGIDISHLTHVINYTFPESAAVYVHRTGRTGRAGRTGCAISLVSPDELGRLYYLRLEYKITPVERSLPTQGELKTRQEIDRVAMLESAFTHTPSAADLAIARRLLTHPAADQILAGMLHTFLGTHDEVDEEAAAARRSRRPTAMAPAPELTSEPDPAPRHGPPPRRGRPDGDRDAARARPTRETRLRDALPHEQQLREQQPREQRDREQRDREQRAREQRPPNDRVTARPAPQPTAAAEQERSHEPNTSEDSAHDESNAARLSGILYLNVGKRDGVRVGEIARLVRESCQLEREQVGRIRVRDRYTFVDVPEERLDAIIEKLKGQQLNDRELAPERAKAARN